MTAPAQTLEERLELAASQSYSTPDEILFKQAAAEITRLKAALSSCHPRTIAGGPSGFYVASRASVPERPAMWRSLRERGLPIKATWIDEAGEGETADLDELWQRIHREISASEGTILYAENGDFPLKGALIECGMTLGMGKPVAIILRGIELEERSFRPLGSWAAHPLCAFVSTIHEAKRFIRSLSRMKAGNEPTS